MYEQSVYVGSTFLGSFVRPAMLVHAERQPPRSYAYFCPACGEVWARCPVTRLHSADGGSGGNRGSVQEWQIQGGYCQLHPGPSPYTVAGSLLLSWEPEYSNYLLSCPMVVKREFEVHLDFLERRLKHDLT